MTAPDTNQDYFYTPSPSSQPRMKLQLTPGPGDIESDGKPTHAKAIAVHVTGGGRATISYIPTDNDDADVVAIEVPDGWVSDTSVRRVTALTADQGTATVWGLFN